jgi:zinc/manganese transport system substrate-binding protein
MSNKCRCASQRILWGLCVFIFAQPATPAVAQTLRVCATVPELGSLTREIGGEHVTVSTFAKGTEDPHFVEAKPSFIKTLSDCDLYVQGGMGLESGWVPVLLQNARNGKILPGAPGYVDASIVIAPLEVPTTPVDRSMGDVHPSGNPHYLSDPLNGLKVAALLRDKLSVLQPGDAKYFSDRYVNFRQRVGTALVGEELTKKYEFEKLALLFEHGKLGDFLQSQGDAASLSGWLALMDHSFGAKVVADHNMWPYFARRFGLTIVDYLEPKPGIPPSTAHLNALVRTMKVSRVKAVLASAYYDPRYASFVAQNTGAKVVPMANQAGARPGTEEYLSMVDYNVRQVAAALGDEH